MFHITHMSRAGVLCCVTKAHETCCARLQQQQKTSFPSNPPLVAVESAWYLEVSREKRAVKHALVGLEVSRKKTASKRGRRQSSPWLRKRDNRSQRFCYANTETRKTVWTEPVEAWREAKQWWATTQEQNIFLCKCEDAPNSVEGACRGMARANPNRTSESLIIGLQNVIKSTALALYCFFFI